MDERAKLTYQKIKELELDTTPYEIVLLGEKFTILPRVWSPKYFSDTKWFTNELMKIVKPGEQWIDMGCGSGITTIKLAKKGANILAIDFNEQAVKNTQYNIKQHGVQKNATAIVSDLFENIPKKVKADVIYWNVPFIPFTPPTYTVTDQGAFAPGYEKHDRFFAQGKSHLKKGGKFIIGFSSDLGEISLLKEKVKHNGLNMHLLKKNDVNCKATKENLSFELYELF